MNFKIEHDYNDKTNSKSLNFFINYNILYEFSYFKNILMISLLLALSNILHVYEIK